MAKSKSKAKKKLSPMRAGEYHEPFDSLPEFVRDQHRALAALAEEVEAVDWYNQRSAVTEDDDLYASLQHFAGEEIEHACMALEWLRRHMPGWDEAMRGILFSDGCIGEKCLRAGDERRSRSASRRLRSI